MHGLVLGVVRIEAGPAEGGTESRRVDGDDRLEAAFRIVSEDDFFVVTIADGLEYAHRDSFPRAPMRV